MECYNCSIKADHYPLYFSENPSSYIEVSTFSGYLDDSYHPICKKCSIQFLLTKYYYKNKRCDLCLGFSQSLHSVYDNITDARFTYGKNSEYNGQWKILINDQRQKINNWSEVCDKCLISMITNEECIKLKYDGLCNLCQKTHLDDEQPDGSIPAWAKIVRKGIFEYFGFGVFEFVDSVPEVAELEVGCLCVDCLKEIKCKKYIGAKCSLCSKKFHNTYFPSSSDLKLGYGCASKVDKKEIKTFSNSKYSHGKLLFLNDKPSYIEMGNIICDCCIDGLIEEEICCYTENTNSWIDFSSSNNKFPAQIVPSVK